MTRTEVAAHDTDTVRVVVVDSRPLTRVGLHHVADAFGGLTIADETDGAAAALELVARLHPDVVTVGRLAEGDALGLAEQLRANYPGMGIVVLSGSSDDEALFAALDAGASAFVGPTADVAEIGSMLRHAALAPAAFSASGLAGALRRRRTSPQHVLSPREREVLDLLHRGHSIPAVAEALFISASTAKTYVARLYDKLGANTRAQALLTAVERGLVGAASPAH